METLKMTREEAIEILRNLLKELTKDFDALTEEEHEAFNMAISSLAIDDMNDMPRKEAIELLDNLIGMVDDNHGSDYDTALHMAIKALEQIPKLQNRCYALTYGQMCIFCPYECEHRKEVEPHESEDNK